MNFDTLTVAYDDLVATHVRLTQNNNSITQDFNLNGDIYFSSPLEYGPRSTIDKAIRDCKEDFIKFIIRELGKAERFKNMIIDEDNILKQFGIGYGSIKKYGDGFKAQDIVDCFKDLYDTNNIEQVIHNQILTTAKRTLNWHFGDTTKEIKRFGKGDSGIVLRHYDGYNGANESPTTELIKLLFIKYEGVSSLSAKTFDIDVGDTLSKSDLPFCENLKAFKNGNLKIKFATKERADEVCDLLLGD